MRRCASALLVSVWIAFAPNAFGWGNSGHQTVGAIADRLIANSNAADGVKALLQPGESLESISIWADCAKGYCGPLTAEMQEFVNGNPQHHDYHFTDLPFELNAYAEGAVGTTDRDVVHVLRQCVSVLRGDTSAQSNPHNLTPRQALLLLTHLVGDLHQPLHVGTAYMDTGNHYVIPTTQSSVDEASIFARHGDNDLLKGSAALHGYWDTQAVKSAMSAAHATTPCYRAGVSVHQRHPEVKTCWRRY
ncbi:MAG TPA: S1/P1 nuclease [Burkholderiaceae bacterium]|nr:S1/P1 nuclease [Burkholderiaceae bacterium]